MKKIKRPIVFESPRAWHSWAMKFYLSRGFDVWVVEPFHAYHHERGVRFFPPLLPKGVEKLLAQGKVQLLKAKEVEPRTIMTLSAEYGVGRIEAIYPIFRARHQRIIDFICGRLDSSGAEDAFRKMLSDRLAVFYSLNILMDRIQKRFAHQPLRLILDGHLGAYRNMADMLAMAHQEFSSPGNVRFGKIMFIESFLKTFKENLISFVVLTGQMVLSLLGSLLSRGSRPEKKKYVYGIAITSPSRQLTGNQRGADFLVDGEKIKSCEVVCFPLIRMNFYQKQSLSKVRGDVCLDAVKKWQNFSHGFTWFKFWLLVIVHECFEPLSVTQESMKLLYEYFRWDRILSRMEMKHFITHCDFGGIRLARNLALAQRGVATWYFTDSMNFMFNFREEDSTILMRQPGWSYLHYDHLVTWDQALVDYFKSHPGSFKHYHVLGCLWAEHINGHQKQTRSLPDKFIVAVFDTTYSRNSYTSYEEGIAFARDILRLSREVPQIQIVFKEKKNRTMHQELDPVLGPQLIDLYNEMSRCPQITMKPYDEDTATVMAQAMVGISFPFTSTTFEALSVNKPAVWHDPLGYYRKTPYGKTNGVMTHTYDALKAFLENFQKKGLATYVNPVGKDSSLLDPYRDGRAIERFRILLSSRGDPSKDSNQKQCDLGSVILK